MIYYRKVTLVGNPNCGKTALINALTGSRLKVGNWPGVTVEKKSGLLKVKNKEIELVDLPGVYSLTTPNPSLDEQITHDYILKEDPGLIINVIDATNFERSCYLTSQLLDLNNPMIVVISMLDVANRQRINIDTKAIARKLNCPVIAVSATKSIGITELTELISEMQRFQKIALHQLTYPMEIRYAIKALQKQQPQLKAFACLQQLEQNTLANNIEDADILIADTRYEFAYEMNQSFVKKNATAQKNITKNIDRFVLNRLLGIPLFLGIMYLMFLFAINIGGAFQDFFDITSDTIFVQGLAHALQALQAPNWLTAILASGLGRGLNTTVTFIPVIGAMFLFLAFLEESGYMARAAFVMDRLMRAVGLPGKSFVPMIVGFGCNVPAIMAARTLENRRDRILTIIMSPFMSCGARLAIFAVFTAAFFPHGGQNIVFALYIIGILMAVLTGLLLRKTILQGNPAPFIMELPAYRLPTCRSVLSQAWLRLKRFISKAGRFIIPICILIGALNAITINGNFISGDANQTSLLSALGRLLTPIFAPMGLHQDNWPATVGLLTGTLAKEVVIATLNTLYTQVGHLSALAHSHFHFWGNLRDAVMSIPENLKALPQAFSNPILASAPAQAVNQGVYGVMYQRFAGQASAFAYLLFVLLYVPCVSTTAVMARELNKTWALFSVLWSLGLAYAAATVFYQLATFSAHPRYSLACIMVIMSVFALTIFVLRSYAQGLTKAKSVVGVV